MFARGSEWRKWDLQIHTPCSVLNNGFGDDWELYAKTLFQAAVDRNVAVVGVTDYFCIEGYKYLRKFQKDAQALQELLGPRIADEAARIVLIPNVEFRITPLVADGDKQNRVNFHVLFSPDIEPEDIDEYFLRELRFTAESNPDSQDNRWSLTLRNLEDLGKRLKSEHDNFRKHSDLYVGMLTAVVSHEDIANVLAQQPGRFKDRYLLVCPVDEDLSRISWDGQGHLVRKLLIQKSHMLFSSNAGTREFALGRRHSTVAEFCQEFGSRKPCIHGSDAHTPQQLFEPAERRYLWIKADPTFHGLRQLLHEPEDRVYIGEEPPALARIRSNPTKYVSELHFHRTSEAKDDEQWFSGSYPLNSGLVAIIGNKGSGKSAFADVLGLLGNSLASKHFSFLNSGRFLQPRTRLGSKFRATLHWASGHAVDRSLAESVDPSAPERVKYIPQSYLEEICDDIKEPSESKFYAELMDVIFSHVDEPNRLGKRDLPSLLAYLTREQENAIELLRNQLTNINREIIELEELLRPEHKKRLDALLAQRQMELQAHYAAKPVEVPVPGRDDDTQEAVRALAEQIRQLGTSLAAIEEQLDRARKAQSHAAKQIAAADRLLARIDNLRRNLATFNEESAEDAELLNLDLSDLVKLSVASEPILAIRKEAQDRYSAAVAALDPTASGSTAAQQAELAAQLAARKEALDEPHRRYESYLQQLAAWDERRQEIEGAADIPDSVEGISAELSSLQEMPRRLRERRADRLTLVKDIFLLKQQLLEDYRKLYSPVQNFVTDHPVANDQQLLGFTASIVVEGFTARFFRMIHRGRVGSFYGEEEGTERLGQLLSAADFSTYAGVEAFLAAIQEHLDRDHRSAKRPRVRIADQLRQEATVHALYDYLYGLEYLQPRFELRWQDKPIDQLSPGERGSLLLIFYLLVDKRDVPLVIDQPEENLDNQTVARLLVPAIRYTKERRQIIIVTHNPNLAVVCDAEQVIHASINRSSGNRVSYKAGSIENPAITQLIVNVLEGTKPAFDLRDARYEVLENFD